jgi:hypothetical protein
MAEMSAGMPRTQGSKVIQKKKSKSGNPAKRALEEQG